MGADLIDAIKDVNQGKAFFSPEISRMLVEDYMREIRNRRVEDSYELLTTREREVLSLMAEGRSNAGIGQALWVTEGTVEKHVRSILMKLRLPESAEVHRRVLAVLAFLDAR